MPAKSSTKLRTRRLAQMATQLHVGDDSVGRLNSNSAASSASCSVRAPEPARGSAWASRDRELFEHLPDDGRSAVAALDALPSPFDEADPPVTLTDEQLWRWCSTGVHVIDPAELGLPQALHQLLHAKLKFALHEEYQPGNNIQARVPELSHILASPVVAGAVETLLGPGALQYPHMYCHNLEPVGSEQPSRTFNLAQTGTCHQDAFSPLGRARHHNPWHCYVCYYPQDTHETEATHIIPSSHFNNLVVSDDNARRIALPGKAGTVFITHWDTAHAGGAPGESTRFMVKFAYLRVVHPQAYTVSLWAGGSEFRPNLSSVMHPAASYHVFSWLRGHPRLSAAEVGVLTRPLVNEPNVASEVATTATGDPSVAQLISLLNQQDQERRIAAIYALAAIGQPAVDSLIVDLSEHSCRPQLLMQGDSGALVSADEPNDQQQMPYIWSEDAVVVEDAAYALAAMQPSAELVTKILAAIGSHSPELVEHEWMILNCVFVLGEMGIVALDSNAAVVLMHLARTTQSHRMVRMCLTSLTKIVGAAGTTSDQGDHHSILTATAQFAAECLSCSAREDDWLILSSQSGLFCAHDQVQVLAAELAFALCEPHYIDSLVDALIAALSGTCGYVSEIAAKALLKSGDARGLHAACRYWQAVAWDGTLRLGANY